jgi:pimeloyl-ACP methyl ester carboxylesterase
MSITVEHSIVPVSAGTIHTVASGPVDADPIVFLHGWPEDWSAWSGVMELAAPTHRCIAIDLPGIGGSQLSEPRGDKVFLAELVHEVIESLGLDGVTLVGQDAGGMAAFAYLKRYDSLRRAVIMNTVIPGIPPWEAVLANPYVWHFAFHSIPELPEKLVRHDIRAYFDFFYDAISANPDSIPEQARERYVLSYATDAALRQGFELYRSFRRDAADNQVDGAVATPVLYLRGAAEGGDLRAYETGLRGAGIQQLTVGTIEGAGHFAPEEAPEAVWAAIEGFLAS